MFCIKKDSDVSYTKLSFNARVKVTRECPYTFLSIHFRLFYFVLLLSIYLRWWLAEWVGVLVNGCVSQWSRGYESGWTDTFGRQWVRGRTIEPVGEWVSEWMDAWARGWVSPCVSGEWASEGRMRELVLADWVRDWVSRLDSRVTTLIKMTLKTQ